MEIFFEVTMGSYHGAEICELGGSYVLICPAAIIKKSDCRLYIDDSLVILHHLNRQQTDITR